jgi:hypothetical protein
MLRGLDERFRRIEGLRTRLMDELRRESAEDLVWRPAPEAWSLTGVIEHLVIAEERGLKGLERERPAELGSRFAAGLKLGILSLAAPLPIRVKAPSKGLLPTGIPELPDLAIRWGEARCRLAGVLDAVTPDTLADRRWRHPIAGWLDTGQWLDFIYSHITHHQLQVGRIRSALQAYRAREASHARV